MFPASIYLSAAPAPALVNFHGAPLPPPTQIQKHSLLPMHAPWLYSVRVTSIIQPDKLWTAHDIHWQAPGCSRPVAAKPRREPSNILAQCALCPCVEGNTSCPLPPKATQDLAPGLHSKSTNSYASPFVANFTQNSTTKRLSNLVQS